MTTETPWVWGGRVSGDPVFIAGERYAVGDWFRLSRAVSNVQMSGEIIDIFRNGWGDCSVLFSVGDTGLMSASLLAGATKL